MFVYHHCHWIIKIVYKFQMSFTFLGNFSLRTIIIWNKQHIFRKNYKNQTFLHISKIWDPQMSSLVQFLAIKTLFLEPCLQNYFQIFLFKPSRISMKIQCKMSENSQRSRTKSGLRIAKNNKRLPHVQTHGRKSSISAKID